jgi:hypothetical protein
MNQSNIDSIVREMNKYEFYMHGEITLGISENYLCTHYDVDCTNCPLSHMGIECQDKFIKYIKDR